MTHAFDAVGKRWETLKANFEFADIGFLVLRVAAPVGNYAWLLIAEIPEGDAGTFLWIIRYFIAYSLLLYLLLFLVPERKKTIYGVSLGFDLSYVYLLVVNSGGYDSGFFIGFYLLTALHSFYYGYRGGLLVAAGSAVVYYFSGYSVSALDPAEYFLRAAFLFLIAFPLGVLSGKLRADKGKIESLNSELLDSIGELKRLQDKLVLAEKLSALGRLTSDVAHEIRNPLTVVGGFARRLAKRLPEGAREREYAEIIVSEAARLERILKDILSFSREAKHHKVHASLDDILSEAGAAYGEVCREKKIRLSVESEGGLPLCIVDRDQVRQAVNNLVQNAIDAMSSGGALTLRTRDVRENGVRYVVLEVADTGVGIPSDKIDRIFEPFYSRKEMGQGTGLGLSICKKIMEEHRGLIRVESEPGAGSVFRLLFPYTPPEEAFKAQCWEYMKCGVDKGEGPGKGCPAYPNFGRMCWSVAGIFCETNVPGILAREVHDCRKCGFYLHVEVAGDL